MEGNLYTINTLWQSFDADQPLNVSVIKEYTEKGITYREMYFSGRVQPSGKRPRIYGIFAFKSGTKQSPTVFLLGDVSEGADRSALSGFVSLGCSCFTIDYSGEDEDKERYTFYPIETEYANYKLSGRHFDYVDETAKENCFYEWTSTARYAISAIETFAESNGKIMVLGNRRGACLAWHIAAIDERVSAVSALFFAGWERYRLVFKHTLTAEIDMDDEMRKYLAAIAVESYAPLVKVPFMMLTATNDHETDLERTFDTVKRIPESVPRIFSVAPRLCGLLDGYCKRNMELFIRKYLFGDAIEIPEYPRLRIDLRENQILYTASASRSNTVSKVRLFVSFDRVIPSERNWVELETRSLPGNVYEASCSFDEGNRTVFALAEVTFDNGITLTTNFIYRELWENVDPTPANRSDHVVYRNDMEFDTFTNFLSNSDRRFKDLFLGEAPLAIKTKALGIKGIQSRDYALASYKIGVEYFDAGSENIFRFDVYSKKPQNLRVCFCEVSEGKGEKQYYVDIKLVGGNLWQPVEVRAYELFADDGTFMKDWRSATMVAFFGEYDGDDAPVFNNMLWL